MNMVRASRRISGAKSDRYRQEKAHREKSSPQNGNGTGHMRSVGKMLATIRSPAKSTLCRLLWAAPLRLVVVDYISKTGTRIIFAHPPDRVKVGHLPAEQKSRKGSRPANRPPRALPTDIGGNAPGTAPTSVLIVPMFSGVNQN